MGLRRSILLLWVTFAFVAACGDNIHPRIGDDGGPGDSGGSDAIDAPRDAAKMDAPDAIMCPSGDNVCSGMCSDPGSDDHNCGGCVGSGGTDCTASGQVCTNGICCAAGKINAGGICCNSGEINSGGICCPSGEVNTGGICCPSGDINAGGICCATGQSNCNNTCVDEQTDNNHCGDCSTTCDTGAGQQCTGGHCCATGNLFCGACTDPGTDDHNCGSCGNDCTTSGKLCSSGICCATGEVNTGGICCPVGDVNAGGICCLPGQVNTGGICCLPGQSNCSGTCVNEQTDDNHCGACTTTCSSGQACTNGTCCASGDNLCGGTCSDPNTDNSNCGGCAGLGGTDCVALGDTCSAGICCPSGTSNVGGICCAAGKVNAGGICCNPGQSNCGGMCVNEGSDTNNCGACGLVCPGGDSCLTGHCCAGGDNLCGGACSDPTTDDHNCGSCGNDCTTSGKTCSNGICCASGQFNSGGICCPSGQVNTGGICCPVGDSNCSGTCVNEKNDNSHCGSCTNTCTNPQFCSAGACTLTCGGSTPDLCPGPLCTNLGTDSANCGTCGTACTGGQVCDADGAADELGKCACPAAFPELCGGTCIDPQNDTTNCGGCAGAGGTSCAVGQSCDLGHCCDVGTTFCASNNTCADLQNDNNNCGTCGNVCGNGASCVNGACTCPFGESQCGGGCKITTIDPNNCGSCGNVCGTGVNAGKPLCVSNSCVATCPSPLVSCGGACVNLSDDNKHCGGACDNNTKDCTATGQVCAGGQCVTGIATTGTPAKCVNGGPPIIIPGTGPGGGSDCAGNLADASFTFGLCGCDMNPLSRNLQLDAFNSALGAYKGPAFAGTACSTAADCVKECSITNQPCAQNSNCPAGETCTRFPIPCVNGTCAGGGLGVNTTEHNSADTDVGGDFWSFGTSGVSTGGNLTVLRRTEINGPFTYAKTALLAGDAHIVGGFAAQGGGTASVGSAPVNGDTGTLYEQTVVCPPVTNLPASLALFGTPKCVQQPVTFNKPCDCTNLIPVNQTIIPFFANPANNDDATIGVSPALFDNAAGNIRLDLACGNYYFHTLDASGASITIYVHGHVGLFISGAMRFSQTLNLDLDPTATLDIFVGGGVTVSNNTNLGSPAFPRYTRLYVGSNGCTGSGGTCSVNEDCCGGVCSGTTCVGGGGNIGQAISLSSGGTFNGLLWAGYGTFTHSGQVEMYGSIFTGKFDASGVTIVHYDEGVVSAPNECPPPSGVCDTCADCNNNPCVFGACQANCTDDAQCCPPLHCVGTVGSKTCQL